MRIALTNASVFTGVGGNPEDATLLIEDDRVAGVRAGWEPASGDVDAVVDRDVAARVDVPDRREPALQP